MKKLLLIFNNFLDSFFGIDDFFVGCEEELSLIREGKIVQWGISFYVDSNFYEIYLDNISDLVYYLTNTLIQMKGEISLITWFGLLRKDFRVGRSTFFGILAAIIVANLLIIFIISEKDKLSLSSGFFNLCLYYLLPVYIFNSLTEEGKKLHRWLHNPQPAWLLLLSKLLNGLLALFLSLLVSACFPLYILSKQKDLAFSAIISEALEKNAFHSVIGILISLGITLFVLLLWSLYHRVKLKLGIGSWLFLFAVFILISLLFAGSVFILSHVTNPLLPIILLSFWYLLFFFISMWLIDKQVEA